MVEKIYTKGNQPTCQLYNKYGHSVLECWHQFDENFEPYLIKSQAQGSATDNTSDAQDSNHQDITTTQA